MITPIQNTATQQVREKIRTEGEDYPQISQMDADLKGVSRIHQLSFTTPQAKAVRQLCSCVRISSFICENLRNLRTNFFVKFPQISQTNAGFRGISKVHEPQLTVLQARAARQLNSAFSFLICENLRNLRTNIFFPLLHSADTI